MLCRALVKEDYPAARTLYQVLSAGHTLPGEAAGQAAFVALLSHLGTTVFGARDKGPIVSMATLHILPNMTYQARPYGVIENVATLPAFEGRGFGKAVMHACADAAWAAGAYKIMLLTGRANKAGGFYRALGYDADEKQGFVLRAPVSQ